MHSAIIKAVKAEDALPAVVGSESVGLPVVAAGCCGSDGCC
jgi:hypothetical protein